MANQSFHRTLRDKAAQRPVNSDVERPIFIMLTRWFGSFPEIGILTLPVD